MPIPSVIPGPAAELVLRWQYDGDPADVTGVSRLRGYLTPDRNGTPTFDVGPGVPVAGVPGAYEFTIPTPPDGLYFTDFTVDYADGTVAADRKGSFPQPVVDSGLVTVAEYQRFTGDRTTSPEIAAEALLDAQGLVEDYLRRPGRLALGTFTERLRLYRAEGIDSGYDGAYLIYPRATPVLDAPGLVVLNDVTVAGAFPDGGPFLLGLVGQSVQPYATITYTGGHTNATLPTAIKREIAKTAQNGLRMDVTPFGAVSLRVGDLAVTYGQARYVGAALSQASMQALRKYIRRQGA